MRQNIIRIVFGVILSVFSVVYLIPVFYSILFALKTRAEIYQSPFGLPSGLHWENFPTVWARAHFDVCFWNSVIVAVATTLATLAMASLAAYSFAYFSFRGKRALFLLLLLGMAIPWVVMLFPIFQIMGVLNLTNNLLSVILIYTTMNLPFGVLVLTGFFRTIPKDYFDAARMDGASDFRSLVEIALPLCKPILITLASLVFSGAWNEFLYAIALLQKPGVRTIPVGLLDIRVQYDVQTNLVMTACVISFVIPLVIFLIFHREVVRGMGTGLKF